MTQNNYAINTDYVEDWMIKEVDKKSQAVILRILETFEQLGPLDAREQLPRSKTKFLCDGILEIRVKQYRIAYFWHNSTCYLLHGIRKKRDDWPKKDIQLAKKRKKNIYQP
ncbi:type II toxin-antitoxin system RelE/ParE family toxin [Spirulina sp. CS-785/01]|uniref:type II toxin-antitoxin system RelE/ParE family toxin n=1 Tax=Spirulina sp. CS-785/01 TaxID=3021716 RepID=UPI00232EC02B|nr:type II toxin-antitoxin system RelE/ParE family toxin [Spirulina sp. CS-785/01]MDB9313955.1 type II toxin-antitoxin system RelE/ParE family toxin [Spirulina sp. CS-785/01]